MLLLCSQLAFSAPVPPDVLHTTLFGRVDFTKERLLGRAVITTAPAKGPLLFDAVGLKITSVVVEDRAVGYSYDGQHLTVYTEGGEPLTVTYEASASDGLVFHGEYMSTQFSTWRWLPCVQDPKVRGTFEAKLTTEEGQLLITDGEVSAPAYLWAFAVGPYSRHEQGRQVVYLPKGADPAVALEAFASTGAVLDEIGKLTGHQYTQANYQTVNTPYSAAQEFVGGAFIGEPQVKRSPPTNNSAPWYVTHEAWHQWFAVLAPVPAWGDHWINEGFASWGEQWVSAELYKNPALLTEHEQSKERKLAAWEQRSGGRTLFIPDNPDYGDGVGGGAVYLKAPVVVAALRKKIGERAFHDGVKRYLNRAGGTEGLREAMEASCGCSLGAFFDFNVLENHLGGVR